MNNETGLNYFIQQNSPDGGFLQSSEWKNFQESVGRKTYSITGESFNASIIEHRLPIAGKYFYVPRGPVVEMSDAKFRLEDELQKLMKLAKENKAGWIRIEPANGEILKKIQKNTKYKIAKAPHDMQPRELFVIDISKTEEEILAGMKQKTRYNVRLAEKKGVKTFSSREKKYIDEFLRLTRITGQRDKITTHSENYYRKMLEMIPEGILKLYVAEYQGKIICANLVVFYGETCTYLHGASDDEYRNVMAPYLLQWQQIQEAKAAGCQKYDFGGVKMNLRGGKSWAGVTRFKLAFSPETEPTEFPGSYDIILNGQKYLLYKLLGKAMPLVKAVMKIEG